MRGLQDPVLINEWHSVIKSEDLQDKPAQAIILGERIVLYRTADGTPHAMRDLCVHRGAALSLGHVQDDLLVCPYHGWMYDEQGRCVCIPAQQERKIPSKSATSVYSCKEKYGLVWVNMGQPADDIPVFEEHEDPSYRSVVSGPYRVKAAAPRVLENFLDFSHLMWLHAGLLGSPDHPDVPDYKVMPHNGGIRTEAVPIYRPHADASGKSTVNLYVKEALRPLTGKFRKETEGSGDVIAMMLNTRPVLANETICYIVISRNFAHDVPDDKYVEFQDLVMGQDTAVVESQEPEYLPLDLQAELSLKSDQMSIAYRKWLKELGVTIGTA
ncbi:aromatic ring-hydroxylating oxygenase subunit alpha [Paenibacillus humicola]|uniref:aromatic ring-hydroxylating oxygenase subunit alpha n=1 Tax=Paenibacillus humicola TaxID=3110540 RepID=UPI00237AE848|nr:aromatic ring-hydroxylating dioxygenase subunit alpha [Paenibacillus humicola]